jgi:hypothetical protein
VPAGRAMLGGLERIAEPHVRSAALRAALVDNPVSAQPLWAAVESWGGVRRPEGGPVLVTHLGTAEALLARDAEGPSGGGPSALLAVHTRRPSSFLRAPDRFLASRAAPRVLSAVERSALAYLETRAGGRDVHVPMLVDAVLAGLLGDWLGVEEHARAARLMGLAGAVARVALDPWPDQSEALGPLVAELLASLEQGPVARLESYWLGALATHDRLAARAATIDSLVMLAGPVAMGLRGALARALSRGRVQDSSAQDSSAQDSSAQDSSAQDSSAQDSSAQGSSAQGSSAESGTRSALPSFDATPGPALLGLCAEGGVHPAIDRGDRVLISVCHLQRSARECGREPALPWLACGALTPVCGGTFHGILRALTRCHLLESRGPSGFRFAALEPVPARDPQRPWSLRWWR